jgi:hypothetical protein
MRLCRIMRRWNCRKRKSKGKRQMARMPWRAGCTPAAEDGEYRHVIEEWISENHQASKWARAALIACDDSKNTNSENNDVV